MAFKFVVLMCAVVCAQAGVIAPATYAAAPVAYHAAPVIAKVATPLAYAKVEEYNSHPQYTYSYGVQDGHTGDSKSQTESRDGDVVHGSYSLIDSDGFKRTVEYTADDHNGFNAVVHREPLGHAPVVAKVSAPVAYQAAPVVHAAPAVYHAAPLVAKVATPVTYHSAPVAYHAAPVVTKVASPVAYAAAPVAYQTYHAAPVVAKVAAPIAYAAPQYYHH